MGTESDREQEVGRFAQDDSPLWARAGGRRTALYSNSLLLVMFLIFMGSWLAQSVTGWTVHNEQAQQHMGSQVGWLAYIGTSDFWEATLQNWQSEFLAVGSLAVFSIYLRQRGSSQSKPVGAAHAETATEG